MLMFADHENRPPISRSTIRTDRPFSSPGLLSNVWWADKPLSKVLRMRTTLTVTLLGLITLLVVTSPSAQRVESISPLVFFASLKECIDTTHNTYVYDYTVSAAPQRSRLRVFWLFYARFSLCVFSIRATSVRLNRRASAILKGY